MEKKKTGILKRISGGLAKLPENILTATGTFADTISYVRLFAVGLATKEVAMSFNGMANDIGFEGIFSASMAILIILFGHTINLLLAAMAVLVHGVRLNLLESSRHLNIQSSGIPYKPFKMIIPKA